MVCMLTDVITISQKVSKWHTAFKNIKGLDAWKVDPYIRIKGEKKIRRTPGDPVTVKKIWNNYSHWLQMRAAIVSMPIEVLVATIATESGGKPSAVRKEPGFISVKKTPDQISVGLMQTLVSTARSVARTKSIGVRHLKDPALSIIYGSKYYSELRSETGRDPVLCAAAYNSGGIYYSPNKKFGLRCYTNGSYNHILKFIAWYNDFVYVLLNEEPVFPDMG